MNKPALNKSILMNFNTWVLIVFGMFSSFSLSSQNDAKFTVRLRLSVHDGNYKNALITITKNGQPFKVIDPDGSVKSVDFDPRERYLPQCEI